MRQNIDLEKLNSLPTAEELISAEFGEKGSASRGSASRERFDAKSRAWYYAEILKDARKAAGLTQKQLAEKIGKKREYISMLEKGETDMQLSTFIMISDAVGLKISLAYA